jgi:hypothetical protein
MALVFCVFAKAAPVSNRFIRTPRIYLPLFCAFPARQDNMSVGCGIAAGAGGGNGDGEWTD